MWFLVSGYLKNCCIGFTRQEGDRRVCHCCSVQRLDRLLPVAVFG